MNRHLSLKILATTVPVACLCFSSATAGDRASLRGVLPIHSQSMLKMQRELARDRRLRRPGPPQQQIRYIFFLFQNLKLGFIIQLKVL